MGTALRNVSWRARDSTFALDRRVRAILGRKDPSGVADGSGTPLVIAPGVFETWGFPELFIIALHARVHSVHTVALADRTREPIDVIAGCVADHLIANGLEDVAGSPTAG